MIEIVWLLNFGLHEKPVRYATIPVRYISSTLFNYLVSGVLPYFDATRQVANLRQSH